MTGAGNGAEAELQTRDKARTHLSPSQDSVRFQPNTKAAPMTEMGALHSNYFRCRPEGVIEGVPTCLRWDGKQCAA